MLGGQSCSGHCSVSVLTTTKLQLILYIYVFSTSERFSEKNLLTDQESWKLVI